MAYKILNWAKLEAKDFFRIYSGCMKKFYSGHESYLFKEIGDDFRRIKKERYEACPLIDNPYAKRRD